MIVKLLRLPASERRPLLAAALLLPLLRWGLVWFGFRRCWSWLRRTLPEAARATTSPPPHTPAEVTAAVVAVQRAARHLPGTYACLPRSLTLWWLLRRQSFDAQLRLGVHLRDREVDTTNHDRLSAHAWVELDGQPLGETDDVETTFAVLDPDLERKM